MSRQRGKAQAHLVPHFTSGAAWRSDQLLIIERGEGCYVWDDDGDDGTPGTPIVQGFPLNLNDGWNDINFVNEENKILEIRNAQRVDLFFY